MRRRKPHFFCEGVWQRVGGEAMSCQRNLASDANLVRAVREECNCGADEKVVSCVYKSGDTSVNYTCGGREEEEVQYMFVNAVQNFQRRFG